MAYKKCEKCGKKGVRKSLVGYKSPSHLTGKKVNPVYKNVCKYCKHWEGYR